MADHSAKSNWCQPEPAPVPSVRPSARVMPTSGYRPDTLARLSVAVAMLAVMSSRLLPDTQPLAVPVSVATNVAVTVNVVVLARVTTVKVPL